MAIQMRRGLLSAYDKDKMLAGEWGIAIDADTDNQKAYIAFAPGADKEVLFVEDAASQMAEATEEAIETATEEAEAWAHGNTFTVNDYASGDGETTAFTLAETPSSVSNVYVDGAEITAYTLSGATITFTTAPAEGTNNIHVIYTTDVSTDNSKYYAERAATSEANAATSESNAATSEANAATSETNAATSETNAAASEANAATSETNAEAYADRAEQAALTAGFIFFDIETGHLIYTRSDTLTTVDFYLSDGNLFVEVE